jgi:hypothetical protein
MRRINQLWQRQSRICLGVGLVSLVALLMAGLPQATDAQPTLTDLPAKADNEGWGEPSRGLRMRLRAPSGTAYRPRASLPLVLELQNVGDRPRPLDKLPRTIQAEATETTGKKLVVMPLAGPHPWVGRNDSLLPGAVIRWTVPFERLPFTVPPPAATKVSLRFMLPTSELEAGGPVFSNPIQVSVERDPALARLTEADVPDRWGAHMDLFYYDYVPLGGWWSVHVDGAGYVQMAREGYAGHKDSAALPPEGQTQTVVSQEALDKLARLLRQHEIWKASDFFGVSYLDEGAVILSVASAGAVLMGQLPSHAIVDHPELSALTQAIRGWVTSVLATAKADNEGWGDPEDGVQCRLRVEKTRGEAGQTPVLLADVRNRGVRELTVAQAQELCELGLNGEWYRWTGDVDVKSSPFPPGRQYDGIRIRPEPTWQRVTDRWPLTLPPFRSTVRVAFIARPVSPDTGPPVRAVSNRIEIESAPATRPGADAGP